MTREIVNPLNKPTPVLSPAVKIDNLVYTAGQVGVNPETGELAGPGIQEQTRMQAEMLVSASEGQGLIGGPGDHGDPLRPELGAAGRPLAARPGLRRPRRDGRSLGPLRGLGEDPDGLRRHGSGLRLR